MLCAFNLSSEPADMAVKGLGEVLLAQDARVEGAVVRLGPNGALIARA